MSVERPHSGGHTVAASGAASGQSRHAGPEWIAQPSFGPRRPSGEAVGGAVAGGITGGIIFGPIGALAGMVVGALLAVATTRRFSESST